jgi:predicted metallopeptidase
MQTYLDAEDYVRVLLHELAHVSQWIDGKLTYRRGRLCYNLINVEDLSYEDQPHEKEASLLETVLYKQFNDGTKRN